MSYLDFYFIVFLFVSLFVYCLVPAKARKYVILVSSLVFYASSGIEKFIFTGLAFLITYFTTRKIHAIYSAPDENASETETPDGKPKKRRRLDPARKKAAVRYVRAAVVLILFMLAGFKGVNFLTTEGARYASHRDLYDFFVPVGLSYYTFSSIGYILDVYWQKAKFEPNAMTLFSCMIYFPHIVQGPIDKYDKLMPQFDSLPGFRMKEMCFGLQRMIWGYFKKLVIADRIAVVTSTVFADLSTYTGWYVFIAMILSVIQIYADFSGCMDIVLGISEAYGIKMDENFNHPFFATNIAEFWRRWHMTLCNWFRSYVYMPLSVSKTQMKLAMKIRKKHGMGASKAFATIVPMLIVWILTGLWHGTGWNYVLWGVYYGALMSGGVLLQKQYGKMKTALHINEKSRGWIVFTAIRTFLLFGVGRMFTALDRWDSIGVIFKSMFSTWNPWVLFDNSFYDLGLNQKNFRLMLLAVVLLYLVEFRQLKGSIRESIARRNIVLRWIIYFAAIFSVIIFGMYGPGYNASDFVYAGF